MAGEKGSKVLVSVETDPVGLALPSQGMWGSEAVAHIRSGDLASDLYPQSLDGLICQWAMHTHNPALYTVEVKDMSPEGPDTIGKLSFQAFGAKVGQGASPQEARTEAGWV